MLLSFIALKKTRCADCYKTRNRGAKMYKYKGMTICGTCKERRRRHGRLED